MPHHTRGHCLHLVRKRFPIHANACTRCRNRPSAFDVSTSPPSKAVLADVFGGTVYDSIRRPAPAASGRLRSARLSVFALYATAGFLVGVWSGVIPVVARTTHVTPGVLGLVIVISSAGIIVGAQVGGRVQQRSGSIGLCLSGLAIAAFGAVAVGFSGDAVVLCFAFTIFTFGMGLNDVGMNMQAVLVERAYGRPIMAAFHAFFSLGGALGAATILVTARLGWNGLPQLGLGGAAAVVAAFLAAGGLLRKAEEPAGAHEPQGAHESHEPYAVYVSQEAQDAGATTSVPARPRRSAAARLLDDGVVTGPAGWPDLAGEAVPAERIRRPRVRMTRIAWVLGLAALLLMCTEGVAVDWSALQLTQAFHTVAGVSAFGYGAFAVTMTAGRLLVDRVAARVGPAFVVRAGSLLGAAGLVVVVVSPSIWLTLVGWAALGLGLCGGVPQIFTAAGNQPESAIVLSRVLTLGYVGIFGGPALIGLLAQATSVTVAMLAPIALLIVAALLAGAVGRPVRMPSPGVTAVGTGVVD
jgi:MFS family permease